MKRKPFRTMEERIKSNYIVLDFYRKAGIFSFDISISAGDCGTGRSDCGAYKSLQEAKSAASKFIRQYLNSAKHIEILKKFKMMMNLEQPELFDNL